jgi:hypothetical protein
MLLQIHICAIGKYSVLPDESTQFTKIIVRKWRIEKDQVKGAGIRGLQVVTGIGRLHGGAAGLKQINISLQRRNGAWGSFDKYGRRGAT